MRRLLLVMAVAAAALCGLAAPAQVPEMMNYQGRVIVGGTNYQGVGLFKFSLVDAGTNVSRQATATAHITGQFVTSVTIDDGGAGYVSVPSVSFSGGGGSGATAHALTGGGAVTGIVVDTAGTGYSTPPAVIVDAPPDEMAYTAYWSNDGSLSGEPTNSVALTVTRGHFSVLLGDTNLANMTSLPPSVFSRDDLYLRVWFDDGDGFDRLTPDQRIASVAYAMKAGNGGKFDNVVNVGDGAEYSSIAEAVDSIVDNGPDRRYLVKVGPGVYQEPIITMKSFVEIEGSGEELTTIWNTGVTNLNGSGAVIAASNSAIRHLTIVCTNAATASGNYATCLLVGNMGTNEFTARFITCKAFGGYSARGVYCRYASPLLEHVHTEASGDKYSYGFACYYGSPTMDTVTATVYGADWYDNAIDLGQSDAHINNAVAIARGGAGSWNWAVCTSGSDAVLNNVTALAIGTEGQNIGMHCNGGEVLITNSTITGQGSSGENHGLYQFSTTVKAHNSLIEGATTCIYVSNVSSVTYAAGCRLAGNMTAEYGGVITTVFCFDETYTAIP